jgi:hypothetical protein
MLKQRAFFVKKTELGALNWEPNWARQLTLERDRLSIGLKGTFVSKSGTFGYQLVLLSQNQGLLGTNWYFCPKHSKI